MTNERFHSHLSHLIARRLVNTQTVSSNPNFDYLARYAEGIEYVETCLKKFPPGNIFDQMSRSNQLLFSAGVYETTRFDGQIDKNGEPIQRLIDHLANMYDIHCNRFILLPEIAREMEDLQRYNLWTDKKIGDMILIHDISEIIGGDHNQANGESKADENHRHEREHKIFQKYILNLFPQTQQGYISALYERCENASENIYDPIARYIKLIDRFEGNFTARSKAVVVNPTVYNAAVFARGEERYKHSNTAFIESSELARLRFG